jgi:DNA-binding transcriptional MocR family regulator
MALWVELPQHIQALQVYERALAQKISIAPGPIFSVKRGFQNFLRLNFGNPWTAGIERALLQLGQIIAGVSAESSPKRNFPAASKGAMKADARLTVGENSLNR